MNLIPDFSDPDNLHLGLTPLSTTFGKIWEGIDRICRLLTEKCFMNYPTRRLNVT